MKRLRSHGSILGCYIDAGTAEAWRPDASMYPNTLLGKSDVGWSGESLIDVSVPNDALIRILEARVRLCKERGFQAVDFDDVNGYQNCTGFNITASQQISFNLFSADLAHNYGLLVALKNDLDQFKVLSPAFDFAVEESCLAYMD